MHLDWDRGHGPVTGPINAAGAALASAWVGDVAHASPWLAAAVAGTGLLGTHVAGLRKRKPRATLGLYAAAWVGAGGWCSFAMAEGTWTTTVLGSLVAGAVGLGAALAGAHHHEEKVAAEEAHAAEQAELLALDSKRQKIAAEWADRIGRIVTGARVRIVGVELWDSEGGYTLEGDCDGGTKWRDLKPYEDALAADAKLPEGCGVGVGPGAHRGAVLLDVATVNRLIGEDTYPADYSPLTLNGPVPLGLFRDGSVFAPRLRQLTTLLVGRKGSGKTNLSNVFLANYLRMPDNLAPWVIDLNGGGLALPWLHAWDKAGRPGRPPIDWVADTPEKALALARAALAVAKARKPGYKRLEIEANDDKLPVSAQVPGILIGGDEIAELYSPKARRDPVLRETGDILVQVVELARAVAVNALITALRATQDVLSEPQILAQSGLKIGMKSDERELSYLFGWGDRLSPEEAPYPGCGFGKVLDEPARPFKAYRMLPAQIADIVAATSSLRPELDELSRRAAGEAYERRWEGTDHLFGLGPAPEPESVYEAPAPVDFDKPRPKATADWDAPGQPSGVDAQAAIDEAEAVRRRLHDAMNDATRRDPALEQQFRDMLASGGIDWDGPAQPQPAAPRAVPEPTAGLIDDARWPKVFAIVAGAGAAGISPKDTAAAFQAKHPTLPVPHRSAITDWLQKEPKVEQLARGIYAIKEEYR